MDRIGHILHQFFNELGIDQPVRRYQALHMWPRIVGERIAKVTEPERINNGRLFVHVKSDVWRNELIFHKNDIVEKLNKEIGHNTIKDIIWK